MISAKDRVRRAHLAIMQHPQFCRFSGVLACGDVTFTDELPTAATDGWNVRYNPEFVNSTLADDATLRFVILHEGMHKAYRHNKMWRRLFEENAKLANVAADYFVNTELHHADTTGFIKMPAIGIPPSDKYKGWSVAQIYEDLKQSGEEPEDGFDEHDWEDGGVDGEEEAERGKEIDRALRQGEILAKKIGKGTSGTDGMFGDLLHPKVDWRTVLRDFISETCRGRDETTWQRPNRRFLADDILMPSSISTKMEELVIGFDTSGSCFGGNEMTRFVSEITRIVEDVAPSKVHVVYWDTAVVGHQTFDDGQFAVQALTPKGGGGTDGSVLFTYLQQQNIKPQAIVQFTDGYISDWGSTDVPTLWAITSSIKAPFGTTIQVEV